MTQQYYTIPDHLLPEASSFERTQMKLYGNCLVLQDGHEPVYSDKDDPIEQERVEKEEVSHGY